MSAVNPKFTIGDEFPQCTNTALEYLSVCLEGYHVIDAFKSRALSYLGGRSKDMRAQIIAYIHSDEDLGTYYQKKFSDWPHKPNAYDSAMVLLAGFVTNELKTTDEYEALIKKSKQLLSLVEFSFDNEDEKQGFIHDRLTTAEQTFRDESVRAYIDHWYAGHYLVNERCYKASQFEHISTLDQTNQLLAIRLNVGIAPPESKVEYLDPKTVISWLAEYGEPDELIVSLMVQSIEQRLAFSLSISAGNGGIKAALRTIGIIEAGRLLESLEGNNNV
jgi:hypothetical protein